MADVLNTEAAKQRMLARLRAAERTGDLPRAEAVSLPASSLETAPLEVLVQRFATELAKLGVAFHRETDVAQLRARVQLLVGTRACLSWAVDALPYGLSQALPAPQLCAPGTPRPIAAACEVGLTGVHAAIAETGSLVCISTPATPRTASLLPPLHIAVVRPEQLLPTLGSFLRRRPADFPPSSAINVITGPSRTADIELQLTLGVHGPGEVVVIVGPAAPERA